MWLIIAIEYSRFMYVYVEYSRFMYVYVEYNRFIILTRWHCICLILQVDKWLSCTFNINTRHNSL